jgi:hypothetical protein
LVWRIDPVDAGQRLGELVTLGATKRKAVFQTGRELVRLVEDREIIRSDRGFAQAGEHSVPSQGINADDDEVAIGASERVAGARVRPGDDFEPQPKEGAQLALPASDQAGGRDDQHPADKAARQHLPDVKTRHDGLAGTRIIGQQKAKPRLRQHMLINRNALMRQRINAGDFSRECRVEDMTVRKPLGLSYRANTLGIGGKVEVGGSGSLVRVTMGSARCVRLAQEGIKAVFLCGKKPLPRERRRTGLPVFPAIDRREGDTHQLGELNLGQTEPAAQPPNALAGVSL